MPFHQRTVEPARLRQPEAAGAAGAPLFRSLEQVSSHALVCLLEQLADLSRCAGDIFGELEGQAAALGHRTAALHRRLDALHAATARLDHRRVKIPVSNLDEESRWTVHYTAPWHQQENVFLPTTRPPCVEDLHRQAKLNLKSVLRECDKLRQDGYRSSQYYSQGPTFAANSSPFCDDYQDEDEEPDPKCSISSSEEERLSTRRPKTPTSSDFSDLNTRTNWTKSLPLPTPEEKMRQQAQTVQADVVPINITASGGTGQDDVGGRSVDTPDHYSTLGRLDSYRSAGQRSETRDSSCQTEEVKIVPPSVRRIRAQKGQGIAAQMSHFPGSSGNMSVLSDSVGVVFPSRLNSDAGFHSLPRSGARTNVQSLEPRLGALHPAEDADETLAYQRGHLQVDEDFGAAPGTGTLLRPKSQELGHLEGENVTNTVCVVSPHATYSTSIIPNATLSSSSEVIVIHSAQSLGQLDSKITSSSSYTKIKSRDHFLSRQKDGHHSPRGNWTEGHSTIFSQASDPHSSSATTVLSLCDSPVSLNTPANRENGSQAMAYNCRNNLSFPVHPRDLNSKSEASHSGGRGHGGSAEPWEYSASGSGRASPRKPHLATPGYSAPGSNMRSGGLDQTSNKDDARAVYPEDHDGYYTSLHTSSGHGPGNVCNSSDGFGNPRHSVVNIFDGRARKNQGNWSNCQDKNLSRNISLKKAKKPPLPPSRTDSLRRIPKKSVQSNGQVLNESLIASLQHSLQLKLPGKGGSSPSQSPCSDFEEPWLPRSRSQSTVSAGSSLTSATTPNVYALSGVTPAQSDTSSVKSEYTDPWGYYIDYTGVQEDPGNPGGAGPAGSAASPGNGPGRHLPEGSRAAVAPVPEGAVKPKITSPEKSHRVTSPSSGYSSQSNTPTTLTPVPVFLKSVSPANGRGKPKPKVPERKSSLVSSVSISSSSTSLSSNTSTEGSGTMKRLDAVLATPLVAPPLPPLPSPCPSDKSPFLPPPPPLADFPEGSPLPGSPLFPAPPPEALTPFSPPTDAFFPPPPTALSPLLLHSSASLPPLPPALPPSVPPPAPPLDPKLMKDARPFFKTAGQPEPSREACRQPSTKEEGGRPPMPLITTEALQMVQLRPVRKNSGTEVALLREHASQEKRTPVVPQYHLKPSALLKSRNSTNEMESESQPASETSSLPTPAKSSTQGHQDSVAECDVPSRSPGRAGEAEAGPGTAPPHDPPSPSPGRKPPPVSKKPKLFLVVPPPQRDFTAEPSENVSKASPSPTRGEARERCAAGAGSHETDSGSSVLAAGAARSESPGRVEANVPMVQPDASPDPLREEPGAESSADAGDNVESCWSLQDPGPGVLEADTAGSSSEACDFCKEDGSDEVMTPSRPRTTEDLFAAIHRSKRKVLGRKDSDDDHSRNHSPSPPVTPTGAAPSLASQKQVGSIQRSIRKSSTSSDNFKALLLKKGSRSDTSARMSAAEMLKNTDPRFQRSRSEPSPDTPESPSSCSPSKNRRAQEEWAKNEGSMPRSLSFSGPRYGRSRTPPSAASSRYSVRNRIQSSPMTVISEGEGEATEPVDSRALRALGAARGRSLEALAGDGVGGGSLLCAGQPAASRGAQAPGPMEGRPGAEGTDPSEQRGGPQREES
ncbi:NHS-like protein 1 isoform X3 [Physeter macrocephalus]|uniref:NHS-like protein 1 isoform X3 n=1 Tax=Physeter macrocephalus TaxID=9755 RepID=A0A2Y9SP75_PHYMC|nr:NHS-like protein 1 isoform X3 [Physeter catodon]|eukprot:XP_023978175.1 NHS-like protein 1 isoform X1 [Physeter catodon]